MIKPAIKLSAMLLLATLCFNAGEMDVKADGIIGSTAAAGFALTIEDYMKAEEDQVPAQVAAKKTITTQSSKASKAISKKTVAKSSIYDGMALAKVNNYLNVRSRASEDGKVLGKLYKGAGGKIIKEGKYWTKLKSGSVVGFVKNDFLVKGADIEKYGENICNKTATVTTTTLKVREKCSTKASVITLIPLGEEYQVLKESKNWVGIKVDEDVKGFVSKDYVKVQLELDKAISIEEEKRADEKAARLQEEQEQREKAARESKNNSSSSSSSSTSSKSSNSSSSSKSSNSSSNKSSNKKSSDNNSSKSASNNSSDSSTGSNIADYALQFVGNPYVYGGTSLTNGADCSGFTQSVFKHFGISINRSSRTQVSNGSSIGLDSVRAGDLVFYKNGSSIGHVALAIGNGQVVHASSSKTGIIVSNMYYRTPYCARRIV